MISVLVADDSFFMRKMVSEILNTDPEISVVGTAADGEQALKEIARLHPDVVTMDMDMPKMNGLEATKRLKLGPEPRPAVVMLSAFISEKTDVSVNCLLAGAFDCIPKPSGPISLDIRKISKQLCAQVKMAARSRPGSDAQNPTSEPSHPKASAVSSDKTPLILIGASTGGPPVLEEIFSHLPSLPCPVLVVQHMPETFTASLARRLNGLGGMRVREAKEHDRLAQGLTLLARGDRHLIIQSVDASKGAYEVLLSNDAPVHGLRPSIDVLFRSAAETYRGPVIAVLLTGMGEDGRAGIRVIKQKGGHVIVQDPDTCVVDSMVKGVIDDRNADELLAPESIAARLSLLVTDLQS